jgi:uncharacterized membrane protein YqjE
MEKLIGLRRMIVVLFAMINVMVLAFLVLWVRIEAYGIIYAAISASVTLCLAYLGQRALENNKTTEVKL